MWRRLYWLLALATLFVAAIAGCTKYKEIDKSALLWLPSLLDNDTYSVGGGVFGLIGQDLILEINGRQVTLSSDGINPISTGFSVSAGFRTGDSFSVRVASYPHSPTQFCSIGGGSGTVSGSNVTSITINCSEAGLIAGSVTGLNGSGLRLSNSGELASISAGETSYSFFTPLVALANWNVSVSQQPTGPSQSCVVANATGTMTATPVDQLNVDLSCTTNDYAVGGNITGLADNGLELVLRIDGTTVGTLTPFAGAVSYTFTAGAPYYSGRTYELEITQQPAAASCSFGSGLISSGTIGSADVSVAISCASSSHLVSGEVSGLLGSDLTLEMSGGSIQSQTISAPATDYTFPTPVDIDSSVTITIVNPTAATSGTVQSCYFDGGLTQVTHTISSGGYNITPQIICTTNSYQVRALVYGLEVDTINLSINGGVWEPLAADALADPQPYSFGLFESNTAYSVSHQNPAGQSCTIPAPSGTLVGSDVDVVVNCALDNFYVAGNIGVATSAGPAQLQLELSSGGNSFPLTAATGAANYAFTDPLHHGDAYSVAITAQPSDQFCFLPAGGADAQSAAGVVDALDATSYQIHVTCENLYQIDFNVGHIYPQLSDQLTISFAGPNYAPGSSAADLVLLQNALNAGQRHFRNGHEYTLTIAAAPGSQECQLVSAAVTPAGAAVTVAVECRNLYSKLSVGNQHTLAIRSDGYLFSWGNNNGGMLGIGGTITTWLPTPLSIADVYHNDWSEVAAGYWHSLGVRTGQLYGWGWNDVTQLCLGADTTNRDRPTLIDAGPGWSMAAIGHEQTFAIRSGELFACGLNPSGVLGTGDETARNTLTKIGSHNDWINVTSSAASTEVLVRAYGIRADGSLYGWGQNNTASISMLGMGNLDAYRQPTLVPGLSNCSDVTTGTQHSLAICDGGKLFSWGLNAYGQLGHGDTTDRSSPLQVGIESDWQMVHGGFDSTIAIRNSGELYSWGINNVGQLGHGDTTTRHLPARVGSENDWISISGGQYNFGGLRSSGGNSSWLWGSGVAGVHGVGDNSENRQPTRSY